VPWFDGSMPTSSPTFARVSGQYFSAQRPTMPPWEKPTIATCRPLRSRTARSAFTTYSAPTWMSLISWFGSSTEPYGRPAAANPRK
jgi:hypothetical protein